MNSCLRWLGETVPATGSNKRPNLERAFAISRSPARQIVRCQWWRAHQHELVV